jgi:hypothetical protein
MNVYLGFPTKKVEQEALPIWDMEKTLPMQLMVYAWFRRI